MQTDTLTLFTEHRTGGRWTHVGQLVVNFQAPDGTKMSVTLPDDLHALLSRVAALEAKTTRPPA